MIDACSDPVPTSGCGGRACSARSSAFEPRQDAAEPQNRILSVRGPAAVRRLSLHVDLDPREALVADRDLEVGRLGHDRRVGVPGFTSASAPMLECSSSTTPPTMTRPAVKPAVRGDRRRRRNHRGDAAFHVLRAAAVQPAVALDRREWIASSR